jgi:dTDP-glucose 4,6-dehydratase
MPTLLVTGGAGFIGCNFVRLALAQPATRVVVLDKLTYAGRLENLAEVAGHPDYAFVHGDIADRATVRQLFATHRPEVVLNFAAESHVDRSIDDPSAFVETNVRGCFELLEAARHHAATLAPTERAAFRFLHVSTDEVFGSLGPAGKFTETTPYAPNSPYAASKAAADHLVRAYHHTYGLPTLVTNCSNNFGPFQFPEKLIPLMILNALEGKSLPVYGDGKNVRDWLHVDDHCRGIWSALERGAAGESYNLGGEQERTNVEVVAAICEAVEAVLPASENPAIAAAGKRGYRELVVYVTDRPGHDRRYAIDPTKANTELGWTPNHDFDTGLRATVRWYLDHRDWCAAVQQEGTRERIGLGAAPTTSKPTPTTKQGAPV